MTINLDNVDFSKVIAISDLHFGMRNNSKQHNTWCTEFLEFVVKRAQELKIKTLLFLGDWSHNRNSVNISTLNYSHNGMKLLNNNFDNVIMLLGNHDLYFRDTLELHSIPYAQDFSNIHLIDKITTVKDYCFVPWLVGDEYKLIQKIKQPYLFCHAEIAKFRMNAMVEMPDHGGLNSEHFQNQKLVFSGHFHKRQRKGNICYIGNAFPHNFADAGDDDRGLMIWTPGTDPIFEKWLGAPKYRTYNLTEALQDPTGLIDNKTFARITVDADLTYEDLAFIRELFETQLAALDVSFIHGRSDGDDTVLDDSEINFESVDSIVVSHLNSIESTTMNKQRLIEIYQSI
jgi:metallophosphoesterase superfamily enzyme